MHTEINQEWRFEYDAYQIPARVNGVTEQNVCVTEYEYDAAKPAGD
jgi:hypothetical protein